MGNLLLVCTISYSDNHDCIYLMVNFNTAMVEKYWFRIDHLCYGTAQVQSKECTHFTCEKLN